MTMASFLRCFKRQSFIVLLFGLLIHCVNTDNTLCPDGWLAYHGSCYLFPHNVKVTFVEAEHYCRINEAHLVRIDNKLENDFLREYLRGLKAEEHWIGINDIAIEGIWVWHDTGNQASFTDWLPGQPGSEVGQEDCADMAPQYDYRWADLPCSVKRTPMCERSGINGGTEIIG